MKREEIEQELINLAKLRWEYIKEKPEYKNDFDNWLKMDISKDGMKTTDKYHALYFENFPMTEGEKLNDFKERIREKMRGNRCMLVEIENEPCVSLDGTSFFSISDSKIVNKWRIRPPVDIKVTDPNPWTLESLTYSSVKNLGNKVVLHSNMLGNDDLKNFCGEDDVKALEDRFNWWEPNFSYIISEILFKNEEEELWDTFETKKIILEIDLNQNIKYIKQRFNQIISQERKRLIKKGLIEDKRNYPDVMANAIKVYGLRKEGKKWEDIAKEIFPKDFKDPSKLKEKDPDSNPESAIVKVKQYYKKAEELIREGV